MQAINRMVKMRGRTFFFLFYEVSGKDLGRIKLVSVYPNVSLLQRSSFEMEFIMLWS